MSWKASAWAKEQRLGSPAAKSILLCLADYADPDQAQCWPSQAQLSADAEVSERTAREWLQRLEDWGLIERSRRNRGNGARAADMIRLNLDRRITDGAARCAEIKASAAADCESLPAEIAGRTYRQPETEPTGNEGQPTGNGCRAYKEEPSIEPPNGTSQQGAQARERDDFDDPKKIEAAFWRTVKDWPGFAGMPKEPARRAFLALSAEERAEAERKLPAWLVLLKAQRKSYTPAPATYFGEKLWRDVPEAEEAQPSAIEAPPFGPVWGALRWREILLVAPKPAPPPASAFIAELLKRDDEAGQAERLKRQAVHGWPQVSFRDRQAESRKGFATRPEDAGLAGLMEPVPVGSAVFEAWREEHERRGWPWIPDPGSMRVVFFPKGGPAGLEAFADAVRGCVAGSPPATSEASELKGGADNGASEAAE